MKLANELSRKSTGKTLYILHEPTTRLHIADIHRLLEALNRLVADGDSVLVIEHNMDIIKSADISSTWGWRAVKVADASWPPVYRKKW